MPLRHERERERERLGCFAGDGPGGPMPLCCHKPWAQVSVRALCCACVCVTLCVYVCVHVCVVCLHCTESSLGCRCDCCSDERQMMQIEMGLVVDRSVERSSQPPSMLANVCWILSPCQAWCSALAELISEILQQPLKWYSDSPQHYLNGDWNFERFNNLPEVTQLPA